MDLEGVEVFVKVVETSSFTEAGRLLGLPKSTVSRRISRLEDVLGVRLIQRTTRKLALTEAGQTYFARVAPALAEVKAADAAVGEMHATPRGVIRVTAPFDFATSYLPALVTRFAALHPEIQLHVALSDQLVDLIDEGFDLAFRGGRLEDSSLVARPLVRGKSWIVASPEYLAQRGAPTAPAELEVHECVLFRALDGHARWSLEGPGGERLTVTVSGALSADEYGFVKQVAVAGRGVACVPSMLCGPEVAAGRLVHLLPGWGIPGSEIHLVYPSAAHVPHRVALFRDFVLEWSREAPWTGSVE